MKATVSALLALLLLASPLAALGAAQLPGEGRTLEDLQVDVSTGSTTKLGGGDWVRIQVGETVFAVVYGTENNPNNVKMLVEYTRYLGVVEIYDETGELLFTEPVSVGTLVGQSFEALVEFRDGDDDGLFQFPTFWTDFLLDTSDYPRKVLWLRDTSWTLEGPTVTDVDDFTTLVEFAVTATNLPYDIVLPDLGAPPEPSPVGSLDQITFTFHVQVNRAEKTIEMPVWRVVVDEMERPISRESAGTETYTALAVDGSFKYDHYIEGWDWVDEDSRLALETGVFLGSHLPTRIDERAHLKFRTLARAGAEEFHEDVNIVRPRLVTVDEMRFEDEWTRVGRLYWRSDVEVDGVEDTMYFQLHGVRFWEGFAQIAYAGALHTINGVAFLGAFVYPQGAVIFHDPGLEAGAFVPVGLVDVGPLSELAPYLIQAAVAGIVVVGLVVFRTLRRGSSS